MYLDNAATTKIHPQVKEKMDQVSFANYNALYYDAASEVKKQINQCINDIASYMKQDKKKIVFTSGASESNNYIIKGIYWNYPKAHFITSDREHSCVLGAFEFLKQQGADVTVIHSERDVLTFEDVKPHLKDTTKLVSIMSVNNETGIINDVESISRGLRKLGILFHSDITQAVGKIKVDFNVYDYASLSFHKINGPKGIGIAMISLDEKPVPLIHGSDQQNSNRAGTLPNELIVGACEALRLAMDHFDVNQRRLEENRRRVLQFLKKNLGDDFTLNFPDHTVLNIMSCRINGEVNQVFLQENHDVIEASTGSSCSISEPSYVLKSHGFTETEIQETIRISTSLYEEVIFDKAE